MITGNKIIVKIIKDMEINEINKQLYESAFIQNGEFGYHSNNTWKPSIDERELDTMCCGDGDKYVPATVY